MGGTVEVIVGGISAVQLADVGCHVFEKKCMHVHKCVFNTKK